MKEGIFSFELNGQEVLGFDTGLKPRDFARTKIAESIFQYGYIVYPNGNVEVWQSGGVTHLGSEPAETTVIWGPLFPGERLTDSIRSNDKDKALDALRFWLKAWIVLEDKISGMAEITSIKETGIGTGAFIITKENDLFPLGTVFFPPAIFYERSLEAEGVKTTVDNERYKHPDFENNNGISFSAGTMLYRIFCGVDAFDGDNKDDLRRNICEGVFLPPNLALPALDPGMSSLISRAMGSSGSLGLKTAGGELSKRPSPIEIIEFIGPPASGQIAAWLRNLDEEEIIKNNAEKERYLKKSAIAVKTKRFVTRNKIILAVSLMALMLIILFIVDMFGNRSKFTTKGMSPVEVANAYYNAFGELDHALMEGCLTGKAGREDIDLVINLFVISRVRLAYEISTQSFISAQRWIDEGSPATEKIVFGVTDLKLSGFSTDGENARLTAEYILWMPGYNDDDNFMIPESNARIDELDFTLKKGAWHISSVRRF